MAYSNYHLQTTNTQHLSPNTQKYANNQSHQQRLSASSTICHTTECWHGIALPVGYEAQIRPRSGLTLKHGLTVLNSPGTVDADYRGEVMVLLINLSQEDFIIKSGERIAQMVIARHEQAEFQIVEELDETERGAGGYGHTGTK